MTEDSFLKAYLRGCFTGIMQPYLRGNFASWSRCCLKSSLVVTTNCYHIYRSGLFGCKLLKIVFKISLFSVGLLKMICFFIHFIFSQGSVGAQSKRETKMFREEKKDASLTTPWHLCLLQFLSPPSSAVRIRECDWRLIMFEQKS